MPNSNSTKRMVENEVYFRMRNEQVQRGVAELKDMARSHGQDGMVQHDDIPLHFYCECSDENCRLRLQIAPSVYAKIHKRRDQFVVAVGHAEPQVEKVISQTSDYMIVQKDGLPPEKVDRLHNTTTKHE